MNSLFESFYGGGALLILWGALITNLLLPIPTTLHPIHWWRQIAELVSNKVNQANASASQQTLAGTLALALLMLPALAVLLALEPLVWQQNLYQLALLILAMDWRNTELFSRQLIQFMSKEDKTETRRLLEQKCNRETTSLSLLGLGKAGAETMILSFSRQVIGVLFWYALAGGIGALFYRLLLELARLWSPYKPRYQHFSSATHHLFILMDYLPQKLFSMLALLGSSVSVIKQSLIQSKAWHNHATAWLLTGYGNKFELSLGGPAMYGEEKLQRARIGGKVAPATYHLAQVHKHLSTRLYIWLTLQSLILVVIHQGF
ncbi:cobalamin biosynthesis family protein [Vibrio hippocampi]|uniref:Cobalamin biosynthesis protein CbiB n=1 Tax=Vibrio hippocampi TaxID=654686 RepID=A0ABM8ZJX8_9VIBR|nr:cobalamin biosynthesis family protein [Vibrio hippocampi]CAH0527064.1 Cobalamin biosynthesis protein CbiB [Vibrio hippocampi]